MQDSALSEGISRRGFLTLSAAAALTVAAGGTAGCSPHVDSDATGYCTVPLDDRLLRLQRSESAGTALARRYPWIRFGEKGKGRLQIAGCSELPAGVGCDPSSGRSGERTIRLPSGESVLPWSPMFARPTQLCRARPELTPPGIGRLFVKDEGSDTAPLYGNKIRKYEFLLPNLACSGVRTLRTVGAYGSNHCAYLTLAARYGRYLPGEKPGGMSVEVDLYPQELSGNVLTKLRLLLASGARLRFLDGDASAGLAIVGEELRTRSFPASDVGYVPPGGSSPLTVLGHLEAALELAEQIRSGACELEAPPDYIFVPLGSGATAMGLVLGCHLLGWETTVVGTCSQDKGVLARLAVNGDAATPFLHGNAAHLLEGSLGWVRALGLQRGPGGIPSAQALLRRHFACDSESWHPAYGKVSPEVAREAAAAAGAGLLLDNTFTAKSFHTLNRYARAGLLRNRNVIFWNSYHRFPLERMLPRDENWTRALPEPLRGEVEAFRSRKKDA